MQSRGLGHSSCNGDNRVYPNTEGTWLELVTAPPSQVWTDRALVIRKLREQGETLADIGHRFGLSAERVRQILVQEGQEIRDIAGSKSAADDNAESPNGNPACARTSSRPFASP